jgi:hypothetical protein
LSSVALAEGEGGRRKPRHIYQQPTTDYQQPKNPPSAIFYLTKVKITLVFIKGVSVNNVSDAKIIKLSHGSVFRFTYKINNAFNSIYKLESSENNSRIEYLSVMDSDNRRLGKAVCVQVEDKRMLVSEDKSADDIIILRGYKMVDFPNSFRVYQNRIMYFYAEKSTGIFLLQDIHKDHEQNILKSIDNDLEKGFKYATDRTRKLRISGSFKRDILK